MKPHQQRVIEEKAELDSKKLKLAEFVRGETFKTLNTYEQDRLRRQRHHMEQYSKILGERIEAFKPCP